MSGVTKHYFDSDIRDILHMWNQQLKTISQTLPADYTHLDIVKALKHFYPHEWFSVEMKHRYYNQKDKYLKRICGKTRYNMVSAEKLLTKASQYKILMSYQYKSNYIKCFSDSACVKAKKSLWMQREPRIQKINQKIERAKNRVQQVTPNYIHQMIGLYERKNTSQKDRLYILAELKKYYSPEIIQFFFKLNDTELNKQLRWDAFYHLQSFNYQPRARRQKYMQIHTKNQKRRNYLKNIYPDECSVIVHTPNELEYRIENSKEQKIKKYDFFISHSYKNGSSVQKLIKYENQSGYDVFCDWINDSDYLKRHLLCDATLGVIKKRLEQSSALIFVKSDESLSSIWCKYELNYFHELGKPIYTISIQSIEDDTFSLEMEIDDWFLDANYKSLALLDGTSIVSK